MLTFTTVKNLIPDGHATKPAKEAVEGQKEWRTLEGLSKQINFFQNNWKADDQNRTRILNSKFTELKDSINELQTFTGYKKKPKESLTPELKNINESCKEMLSQLNSEGVTKETLTGIEERIKTTKSQHADLKKEIESISDHLKNKIHLNKDPLHPNSNNLGDFFLRIGKIISPPFIHHVLEESHQKDLSRKQHYEEMITLWNQASLNLDKAQLLAFKHNLPILKASIEEEIHAEEGQYCKEKTEFEEEIRRAEEIKSTEKINSEQQFQDLPTTLKNLLKTLEENNISRFADGFNEDKKSRSLTPFTLSLDAARKTLKVNEINALSLERKNQIKAKFHLQIKHRFDLISKEFSASSPIQLISKEFDHFSLVDKRESKAGANVEKNKNEIKVNLEEEKFKLDLEKQREEAEKEISQLKNEIVKLRNEIVKDWDDFCFKLNEIRHDFSIIEKYKDFKINLTSYYLKAEQMRSNFRDVRKDEKDRQKHFNCLETKRPEAEKLLESISAFIQNTETMTTRLQKEIEQINKSIISEQHNTETIGLVCSSKEEQVLKTTKLNEQRNTFLKEFQTLEREMIDAISENKPLGHMCHLIVEENNVMMKVLNDPSLDSEKNNFNTAYPFKSSTGQFFASKGKAMFSYFSSKEPAPASDKPSSSNALAIRSEKNSKDELPLPRPLSTLELNTPFKPSITTPAKLI